MQKGSKIALPAQGEPAEQEEKTDRPITDLELTSAEISGDIGETSMPSSSTVAEVVHEAEKHSESEIDPHADWQEYFGIEKEARLSYFLPKRWERTQEEHEKQPLVSPASGKGKGPIVGFIHLTAGSGHEMPGTSAPAAVRYERYQEEEFQASLVEGAQHDWYAPCLAHGDYVKVESLQSDHFVAKATIRQRQEALVKKLNTNPEFAAFIMRQKGMDKFFIKEDDTYYGTRFFYEIYFNDIDNIWLICEACNLYKSDEETEKWLREHWLYGQEFLDYVAEKRRKAEAEGKKPSPILEKITEREGLAQVAIAWFWKRHANYISTQQKELETIKVPLQILSIKIDHVIGKKQTKRAKRLQACLNFKLLLASKIISAKGLTRPPTDSESSHSSSDESDWLKDEKENPVSASNSEYDLVIGGVAGRVVPIFKTEVIEELKIVKKRRREMEKGNKTTEMESDKIDDEPYLKKQKTR